MGGKTSRSKGARGELEFLEACKMRGYHGMRGLQSRGGGKEIPDVEIEELPHLHFEVKRVEKLRFWDSIKQAADDADEGQLPIVVTRRSRSRWMAILPMEDLFALFECVDWELWALDRGIAPLVDVWKEPRAVVSRVRAAAGTEPPEAEP